MTSIAKKPDKIRLFRAGIFFVHLRWWAMINLKQILSLFLSINEISSCIVLTREILSAYIGMYLFAIANFVF